MPKPSPIPDYMKRVPGRKAPYEIALEQEEEAVRRARANPVIRDGGMSFRCFTCIPIDNLLGQTSNIGHHAHINRACQNARSSFLHSDLI